MPCNLPVFSPRVSCGAGGGYLKRLSQPSQDFCYAWRQCAAAGSSAPLVSSIASNSGRMCSGGGSGFPALRSCYRFVSLSDLAKAFQAMDSHANPSSSVRKTMPLSPHGKPPRGSPGTHTGPDSKMPRHAHPSASCQRDEELPHWSSGKTSANRWVSRDTNTNYTSASPHSSTDHASSGVGSKSSYRHVSVLGPLSESYAATLRRTYRVKRGDVGMAALSSGKSVEALFHSELQSNLRQLEYSTMIICVLEVLTRFSKEMLHADDSVYLNCVLSDRILELVLMCLVKLPDLYTIEAEIDRWISDPEDVERDDEESFSVVTDSSAAPDTKLSPSRLYESLWTYYHTASITTLLPEEQEAAHPEQQSHGPPRSSSTVVAICTTFLSWLEQRASQFSVLMSTRVLQLLTQQPYLTSTALLETLADNISVYCVLCGDDPPGLSPINGKPQNDEGRDHAKGTTNEQEEKPPLTSLLSVFQSSRSMSSMIPRGSPEESKSTVVGHTRNKAQGVNGGVDENIAAWSSKWEAENQDAFCRPNFYAMVLDTILRYQQYAQHANSPLKKIRKDVSDVNASSSSPRAGEILNWDDKNVLSSIQLPSACCVPENAAPAPSPAPRYRSVEESKRQQREHLKKEKYLSLDNVTDTKNLEEGKEKDGLEDGKSDNSRKSATALLSPLLRSELYNGILRQFRNHVRSHDDRSTSMGFRILDIPTTTFFFLLRSLAKLDCYNESTVQVLRDSLLPDLAAYLHQHPEQYLSVLLLLGRKENVVASLEVWETILGILTRLLRNAQNRNKLPHPFTAASSHANAAWEKTNDFTEEKSLGGGALEDETAKENVFLKKNLDNYDEEDNLLFSVEDILETSGTNGRKETVSVTLTQPVDAEKDQTSHRGHLANDNDDNPVPTSSSSSTDILPAFHQSHIGLLSVSLTGALLAALPHVHRLVLSSSDESSALMRENASPEPFNLSKTCWQVRLVAHLNDTFFLILNDIYYSLPSYIGAVRRRKSQVEKNGTFEQPIKFNSETPDREDKRDNAQVAPLFIIRIESSHEGVSGGKASPRTPVFPRRWVNSFFFRLLHYHQLLLLPDPHIAMENGVSFHVTLWNNVYHCQTAALLCRSIQQLLIQVLDNGKAMLPKETVLALQNLFRKDVQTPEENIGRERSEDVHHNRDEHFLWWYHPLVVELVLLWSQLLPFLALSRSPYTHGERLVEKPKVYCSPATTRQIQLLVKHLKYFGLLDEKVASSEEEPRSGMGKDVKQRYTVPQHLWSRSPGLSQRWFVQHGDNQHGREEIHSMERPTSIRMEDSSFQLMSLVVSDIVQEEDMDECL